jgi:hypothetical protein
VQELEAGDEQILVPAEIDRRTPGLPAFGSPALVEHGAKETDDHDRLYHWR